MSPSRFEEQQAKRLSPEELDPRHSAIEAQFIATMFSLNGKHMHLYASRVTDTWFLYEPFANVWKHMRAHYQQHKNLDKDLVLDKAYPNWAKVQETGVWQEYTQTAAYIFTLTDYSFGTAHAARYHDLRMQYRKRKMMELTDMKGKMLVKPEADLDEVDVWYERALRELKEETDDVHIDTPSHVADAMFSQYIQDSNDKELGIFRQTVFGIDAIDTFTGGIRGGQVYILAAPTGCGKSAVAINIAKHVAQQGRRVLYFSLEMKQEQILFRLWASMGQFPVKKLYDHDHELPFMQKLEQVVEKTKDLQLTIVDRGFITPVIIERELQKSMDNPYDLVIIDHVGLMKQDGKRSRYEQQTQHINEINQLCMEYNTSALVLTQLTKQATLVNGKETDEAPKMGHIKDSSAIAEIAEAIFLLHRPKSDQDCRQGKKIMLTIPKARNSTTDGDIVLHTNLANMYVSPYADVPLF